MTTLMRTVTAVMLISGATTHMAALQQNPVVVFETEKGAIEVEVDTVHAPASAANFLKIRGRRVLRGRQRQSRGATGQHHTARRRNPGHPVPDEPGAPG